MCNLCQTKQEKKQVFPCLAVQILQDRVRTDFSRVSRDLGRSSWLSLYWRTCERSNMNKSTPVASPKPLLSLCLQQSLSSAKEYLKMNHGHLSSRLGQSSQPQQFVKRIISWVSFWSKSRTYKTRFIFLQLSMEVFYQWYSKINPPMPSLHTLSHRELADLTSTKTAPET